MKKLLSIIFLALLCVSVRAQLVTGTLVITNAPTNSITMTVNGNVFYWTNGTPVGSFAMLITNTLPGDGTNLYNVAGTFLPSVGIFVTQTNATNFTFRGNGMVMSIQTNWASLVLTTNSNGTGTNVTVPMSTLDASARTNIASQLISDLNLNSTNAINQTNAISGQLVGLTNTQTIGGAKTFTNANVYSNSAQQFVGGTNSNQTFIGPQLGTNNVASSFVVFSFGKDPNSLYESLPFRLRWVTNAVGGYLEFDDGVNGEEVTLQAAIQATTLTIGNFNTIGSIVSVSGTGGAIQATTNPIGIVPYGIAITGSQTVSGGFQVVGNQTNVNSIGTNIINASLILRRYNNTSLANGANAAIVTGTNAYFKVTGPSAAFTINGLANGIDDEIVYLENSTGQQITIANDSGVDPTAANRIYTPGRADLISTNNPGIFGFKYDASVTRWLLFSVNGVQAVGGSGTFSGTFVGSIIVGNATNTPSFTLVNTNWVSGALYTNNTGRPMLVSGGVVLTAALISGMSQMALAVPGSVTNYSSFPTTTIIGGFIGGVTNGMSPAWVTNGGTFNWTNTSTGSGDTSTTWGGQYMVY